MNDEELISEICNELSLHYRLDIYYIARALCAIVGKEANRIFDEEDGDLDKSPILKYVSAHILSVIKINKPGLPIDQLIHEAFQSIMKFKAIMFVEPLKELLEKHCLAFMKLYDSKEE